MTDSLHSEVLVPTHSHLRRAIVAALGFGAIGAAIALALAPPPASVTVIAVQPDPENLPMSIESTEPAQTVRSPAVSLVFSAGDASYMKLADIGEDGEPMPPHAAPRPSNADGIETAIANVDPRDVPVAYQFWLGRDVIVDNTCKTRVTGFAVVSRLVGDTGYANTEDTEWNASNVFENGSPVLAARLADCEGAFARDAALPLVAEPVEIRDHELASKARAALIASTPAQDAQHDWLEYDQQRAWYDSEEAVFKTRVVRHPGTGVTWVSVHGSVNQGCGGVDINVWGLFRVQPDGSLAAVQLRKLGDLWSIDRLIDVDNDGELELIGKPWLGLDTILTRASGEELDRLPLPFFGCPC